MNNMISTPNLVETEAEGLATVGGNLSSTILGRTRAETYAYGFIVEFYEKCA